MTDKKVDEASRSKISSKNNVIEFPKIDSCEESWLIGRGPATKTRNGKMGLTVGETDRGKNERMEPWIFKSLLRTGAQRRWIDGFIAR